ncbi:MAG: PilZ domain-containing protein [Candidatus Omnitrophota bacterium]
MKEQRKFDRLTSPGKVVFKDKDIPDAVIMDISYGGIAIYSKEKFEIGQYLSFELKMDLVHEPVKCNGIIKYVIEKESYGALIYKVGIEFVDMNKDGVAFIIKRIQYIFADLQRKKVNSKSPDFIPY